LQGGVLRTVLDEKYLADLRLFESGVNRLLNVVCCVEDRNHRRYAGVGPRAHGMGTADRHGVGTGALDVG
jgi:hypothetical protein